MKFRCALWSYANKKRCSDAPVLGKRVVPGCDVWHAVCPQHGDVVVKRIPRTELNPLEPSTMEDVRGVAGFTQLLRSYDSADALCLAMRPCDGDLLDEALLRDGMPVADARTIAGQVGRALTHLHGETGVAHLDLKPENLFREAESGRFLVGDFGGTHSLEGPRRFRYDTGTPGYMAPELVRGGDGVFCEKTDAYSLGLALYAAITLRRPPRSPGGPEELVGDMLARCEGADERAFVGRVGAMLAPDRSDRASYSVLM